MPGVEPFTDEADRSDRARRARGAKALKPDSLGEQKPE